MKNNIPLFNVNNNCAQFITELQYQVRKNPQKYMLDTAKEVESLFIYILLKSMRHSLEEDNLFDNNQSHLYTEIYDQQISKEVTNKGIGLDKMILKQIQTIKSYNKLLVQKDI